MLSSLRYVLAWDALKRAPTLQFLTTLAGRKTPQYSGHGMPCPYE